MASRTYRLGRRQPSVDRTRAAILAAARDLVSELGPAPGIGHVAGRAGVSRITVYNRFGSKAGLIEALRREIAPEPGGPADPGADPRDELTMRIAAACATWAANSGLHRRLLEQGEEPVESPGDRELAGRLAGADQLRPGCSVKEAADVIGVLTSFPAFDRLHRGGRRSAGSVSEILGRMAEGILPPAV